jgi:hypothetical protein
MNAPGLQECEAPSLSASCLRLLRTLDCQKAARLVLGNHRTCRRNKTLALPIEQHRNSCFLSARVARNEPHVGHAISQAFQSWICKGRVKAGQDPSRAKRGEGDQTLLCALPQSVVLLHEFGCQKFVACFGHPRRQFCRGLGFPYEWAATFAHAAQIDLPVSAEPGR